jgi:hypothetical protein
MLYRLKTHDPVTTCAPITSEHMLSKNRDCLSQALPLERFQVLDHCLGRVFKALAMIFRRCHNGTRCKVEEMKDEFVRPACAACWQWWVAR